MGASIVVEARASDSEAGLAGEIFIAVANGAPFSLAGQFIEVRATLKTTGEASPVLSDIRIQTANEPPDCSAATPSTGVIWPPNHKFVPVSILGVSDADSPALTIAVTSIFQDEPVDTTGDGKFVPDGQGVGTATARGTHRHAQGPRRWPLLSRQLYG